jgi:hypothetical protein
MSNAGSGEHADDKVADISVVHACLRICKMGAKAPTFASIHGITSLENVSTISIAQAKDFIKMYNDTQPCMNNKLGGLHISRLGALIYWTRDCLWRQQPIMATNWTAAKMKLSLTLVESMTSTAGVKRSTSKRLPIDMDLGFFEWKIAIFIKIYTIPSLDGVQLCLYVARETKGYDWNPVTDAVDNTERLWYQVELTGPVFLADNKAS